MPMILAVAVGAAPVTWTVCGLRLLARAGSRTADAGRPEPAEASASPPARCAGTPAAAAA